MNHVRLDIDGAVAQIVLDKPHKLNAIDYDMAEAIAQFADRLRFDREVRAVVLRGEGRAFCAGADFNMPADRVTGRSPAEKVRNYYERFRLVHDRYQVLTHLPQPIVAAIHGHCIGAGIELALMADIRIAADDTHFSLPEVALGIAPDIGGDLRLAREVGAGWAKRLLLTGDDFDAALAARIGVIQDVVPAAQLHERAMAIAQRIAGNAPLAVQATKRQVNFVAEMGLAEALRFEAASAAICFVSDDQARGFRRDSPRSHSGY